MVGTPRIAIVTDVHERASGLQDALTRLGALVEVASLPAGDYAVGAQTIVERKSVLDLHGAILKGRFWPQLWKLRAECEFPYSLVEGRELDRGPLHPNVIRGACLTAMELGIALRGPRTAMTPRDGFTVSRSTPVVSSTHRTDPPTRSVPKSRPEPQPPRLPSLSCPGISVVCARALLARFGSVHAVLQANVEELVTVSGIGSERAQALTETFHHQVASPAPSTAAASPAASHHPPSPT